MLLAVACVGCSGGTSAAPVAKSAAVLPVASLPDLGEFASHVSAEPTTQPTAGESRMAYKVDLPYNQAIGPITTALMRNGWTRKTPIVKLKATFTPFENAEKGRYALDDTPFNGVEGTSTLSFAPNK
jgi:hypothetical protein